MSQNNLDNQLTKTNEEGLLIKLFRIIIGHKRLQAPAKSHPTGMTRLQKKDDWIQKRLHRKAARYLERAASSSSSPERENMHLTIGSVLYVGFSERKRYWVFSLFDSSALLLPTDSRSQPDVTDSCCLRRESIIRSSQAVESMNCSTRLWLRRLMFSAVMFTKFFEDIPSHVTTDRGQIRPRILTCRAMESCKQLGEDPSSEEPGAMAIFWEDECQSSSFLPGRWPSGTALMNPMRPARPKNLAKNTVACPCASESSIHCKHGRRMHDSLQPLRSTRHPLQLMIWIAHPLKTHKTVILPFEIRYFFLFFLFFCFATSDQVFSLHSKLENVHDKQKTLFSFSTET